MHEQDRYKTILVIVTGLLVLATLTRAPGFLYGALGIGLIALLSAPAAKGIERAWLGLAEGLGWLNSKIILSLVYFAFLLPVAWVSRLFTNDPLALRKRKTSTLFITRNHLYTKKDLENIW